LLSSDAGSIWKKLLADHPRPAIASITAGELLIGVERADTPERRARRDEFVENILARMQNIPFDLPQARLYAIHAAELSKRGQVIGDRDLQIAVTALSLDYELATLNIGEFSRVTGLRLVDVSSYSLP